MYIILSRILRVCVAGSKAAAVRERFTVFYLHVLAQYPYPRRPRESFFLYNCQIKLNATYYHVDTFLPVLNAMHFWFSFLFIFHHRVGPNMQTRSGTMQYSAARPLLQPHIWS